MCCFLTSIDFHIVNMHSESFVMATPLWSSPVDDSTERLLKALCSQHHSLIFTSSGVWMDLPFAWCQLCVYGCSFSSVQAHTYHKHSCEKTKKWFSHALDRVKEAWQVKKCRKMEERTAAQVPSDSVPLAAPNNAPSVPMVFISIIFCIHSLIATQSIADHPPMDVDDLAQSLSQ